eukprot:Gregarina_sp_Pseudo_9__1888@NODE_2295_length_1054_cov_147_378325_g2112_i0_p1_GENE_NODE_2295_length_1054_cov_147_378325_g2112_i0NODE_2295_length_1054_cov_147_378325_g2112_i0_p1_ORF_typecomplete_len245_score5_72_NODE_2295_length_1054_cov_147_378325_g2112_i085819
MFSRFLVSIFLVGFAAEQKTSTLLFPQPPLNLKLERIPDVIEGHEDLYLASEFGYRTPWAFEWVGVVSSTGATSLEGASFEWVNAETIPGMMGGDSPLVYMLSGSGYDGLLAAKVTLANGEEVSLKSWLPTKTDCWTNHRGQYASPPGVDEFGEEWPQMNLSWFPQGPFIMYCPLGTTQCGAVTVYTGTNPCDGFRGFASSPAPPDICGEVPAKYQTNNITIVQDGEDIIQYYAQGRSRRFSPV